MCLPSLHVRTVEVDTLTGDGIRLQADASDLDRLLDELAARIAAHVIAAQPPTSTSPYMTPDEAAAYARCTRQRIYDLVSERRLDPGRDGRRLLIKRDDLDRYLQNGDTL